MYMAKTCDSQLDILFKNICIIAYLVTNLLLLTNEHKINKTNHTIIFQLYYNPNKSIIFVTFIQTHLV